MPGNSQSQPPYRGDVVFPTFQQQSALETLAEVSRRHLDYSEQRHANAVGQFQLNVDDGRMLAEQALMAQLQSANSSLDVAQSLMAQDGRRPGEIPPPGVQTSSASALPNQSLGMLSGPTDAFTRAILRSDASQDDSLDPQLGPYDRQQNGTADVSAHMSAEATTWDGTIVQGQHTFGSLAVPAAEPTPSFGLLQNPSKARGRNRFNDVRRKEVQEVRKRGACMRCRMLKKSCSEGTPCTACQSIESARLWKGACLRTRICYEFTLYSKGLFHSKAKIEVPAAVQGLQQLAMPGRIEVRFFSFSDVFVSFAVKQYSEAPGAATLSVDPGLQDGGDPQKTQAEAIWLLDEGEGISDKIESYVTQVAAACIDREKSAFHRDTLWRARTIDDAERAENAKNTTGPSPTRSSYSIHDSLLRNAIELWVETTMLASPDDLALSLQYEPTKTPQKQADIESCELDDARNRIPLTSQSYLLIRSQLLAATESRAWKLARSIMNELERRLLQRQQVSRFGTFISAIILLSCVERITGFYRSFDGEATPMTEDAHGGTTAPLLAVPNSLHITAWPLDEPPNQLWPQGEHFADVLVLLLRIRGLPPITHQGADGTLVVTREFIKRPVGTPLKELDDASVSAAAAWLDEVRLDVRELAEKRDSSPPAREAGLKAWDMRYVAKALLPEMTYALMAMRGERGAANES